MSDGLQTIDCDVHPAVPSMAALAPYLDDFWRDSVEERGIAFLDSISYPPSAPLTVRADWRGKSGGGATKIEPLVETVFDGLGASVAILNCIYGVQLGFNEDMARAFTRAINDWMAKEWLDRDPRLRASIVLPMQSVEFAVEEIERLASDRRFVQVLVLAMQEVPLGRRSLWPIYAACEKHGLPLGIHAGSSYRHPVTSLGWPSYYLEDYVAQAQGFQSQVTSLITEGVFAKFPALKVVLIESGVTWLPGFLWRFSKFWRGLRAEVPWVNRPPDEIVRDHFRLTVQPFDAPEGLEAAERAIEHLRSDDILLFASDYPHWQFDGDEAMPKAIPAALHRKIRIDNPLATYARLMETVR